jgi:hypothetical protein
MRLRSKTAVLLILIRLIKHFDTALLLIRCEGVPNHHVTA